jgi:hypothetical protein
MLNDKQRALLTLAASKTLAQGSGIEIADRQLQSGEFAPIESAKKSGGVIFSAQSIPQEISRKMGVTFLPVLDHTGEEQLALCIHGGDSAGYKLMPLCRIDAGAAGGLVADLMLSAAQYSDPTLQASVVKSVTEAVLASDLAVKDALVANSEQALQTAFSKMISKRLEARQKEFDAAVATIEQKATERASKRFAKAMMELSSIAAEDQRSVRHARLSEMLPTIKGLIHD